MLPRQPCTCFTGHFLLHLAGTFLHRALHSDSLLRTRACHASPACVRRQSSCSWQEFPGAAVDPGRSAKQPSINRLAEAPGLGPCVWRFCLSTLSMLSSWAMLCLCPQRRPWRARNSYFQPATVEILSNECANNSGVELSDTAVLGPGWGLFLPGSAWPEREACCGSAPQLAGG